MKYVIGNWKQNMTLDQLSAWTEKFSKFLGQIDRKAVTVVICPPTPLLSKFKDLQSSIDLGAQDVSQYSDGAHTGSVGVNQLKPLCKYSIVGHSERNEARGDVLEKAKRCFEAGIVPIICFKSPSDFAITEGAIYALEDPQTISHEGVYRFKSQSELINFVNHARSFFGKAATLIYGGSVNSENADLISSVKELDGVLVGNASLNPKDFADIVRKFSL